MLNRSSIRAFVTSVLLLVVCGTARSGAQTLQQGPFKRLVIRGVWIVDGTGGPRV